MKKIILIMSFIFSFNIFPMAKKVEKVPTKKKDLFKKSPVNQLNFVPIQSKLINNKMKDSLTKAVIRNIVQNSNYQLNIGEITSHQSKIPIYKISLEIEREKNKLYTLTSRITDPMNKVLIKKAFNQNVGYNSLIKSTDELIRRLLKNKQVMEHDFN